MFKARLNSKKMKIIIFMEFDHINYNYSVKSTKY